MSWGFDPSSLEADLEWALGWLGDDPVSSDLERVGRLYRWIDQADAGREWFRRAAEDVELYVNKDGGGDGESWARQGGLLLLAGEEQAARGWLSRARDGFELPRDGGRIVEVTYLLGDYDSVLAMATDEDPVAGGLASARVAGDPSRVDAVIAHLGNALRGQKLLIRADVAVFGFADYDWLEEAFVLQAALAGEDPPDHRSMLARAGLAHTGE